MGIGGKAIPPFIDAITEIRVRSLPLFLSFIIFSSLYSGEA